LSSILAKLFTMSTQDVSEPLPSLFDEPVPITVSYAKDFVKWCWSFGDGFRNSPDISNFRYWAQKNKLSILDREEMDVLNSARALFLKRIGQRTRKAESAN
jgi:hypothetical protein